MSAWNDLTMQERADLINIYLSYGITSPDEMRNHYNSRNQFALGGDTVGEWVDAIYQNNPQEEFLGEPSHHYDFTQSEEWANAHGYYPDARGHRDDRVKKPAHPSHPSRGAWDRDKFVLSELGMQNPNYTLFGLNDGGQDPQAILTYKGGSVIPEITVTPNGNYFFNPYDNIKLKFADGGEKRSAKKTNTRPPASNYRFTPAPLISPAFNKEKGSWETEVNVLLPEVVVRAKAPFKKLNFSTVEGNSYLNDQYEEDIKNSIKGSKEAIAEVQREIADEGYYDINTDDLSVDQIKRIQKKIGAKVDGKWGKESTRKWRDYNVDGKWGNRTEEAYNKLRKNAGWENDVPTKGVEWCAEWVSKKVTDATKADNYGVWGDAWRMPQNVVRAGGTEVYNIYKQGNFKDIKDVSDLKKRTEAAIKEAPFDVHDLQIGDIVGIYMPSSNMHEKAWKEGTTYNTHVGVVTGFDKNNMPIIEHNIHQSHKKDAADNISGSLYGKAKIATVSRPSYRAVHTPFNTESTASEYTKEGDSPLYVRYANSVAGSKEMLSKVFPNVNMDEVELITLSVQGRETGFMKNKKSDQRGISKLKARAGDYYRDNIKKKSREQVSSNLAKMKLSSFTINERQLLGLNKPEDLENPEKAGRAATYLMAKNYDYFKRLQETYPNLHITDDDLRYLTELSYNQGMDKLSTIGFTNSGAAAPEELEAIRKMSAPDAKVKDVSATNYRHFGKVGKFLYDMLEEGHTPYISAAEKYRRQLLEASSKRAYGGPLYEYGGPKRPPVVAPRRASNGNRFATMTDAELEASERAADEYWKQQQQAPSIAKSPEEVEAEFREAYPERHEGSSTLQHLSNLFDQATEQQFPITAEGYREAINNQVEEQVDKWHDYKKGVEAAVTATELGLSGTSLLGSYANWRNWANAANATKRGIANLLQRAQLPMQVGGTLIDGAQTYMALREGDDFDAKYNGISAGLGAAGSVGASDVFLNSRFHNQKIDRALDVLGIIQNAGDFLKFGYDSLLGGDKKDGSRRFEGGGPIHIAPSKKGTFTAAATKHGKSVQEFASQVLSHPENYSLTMRKKANFARNASKWKH